MRAAIKHCCYYWKSFLELNSKTPALHVIIWSAYNPINKRHQRELRIATESGECMWSTESFSSLKVCYITEDLVLSHAGETCNTNCRDSLKLSEMTVQCLSQVNAYIN